MIVGGYVLHLYCRNMDLRPGADDTCKMPPDYDLRRAHHPAEYTHPETGSGARTLARLDGWRFTRDGDAECPWCAGRVTGQ